MQGRGYQAFIDRLANQARNDKRRHTHETVGRVLYAVVFSALLAAVATATFQHFGWIK